MREKINEIGREREVEGEEGREGRGTLEVRCKKGDEAEEEGLTTGH